MLLQLLLLLAPQGAIDPAQAVTQLQQAIRREPDRESNYTDLAGVLLRTQNFREAAVVLESARTRFPDSAQVWLSLGVAYYGQRRFPDAVGAFLNAAARDPDAEQPVAFLGRILEHAGERTQAVKGVFETYAKAHPRNYLGHFLYGKAAADAPALTRSIALAPDFWESHFELGAVLESSRNFQGAAVEYEKAARLAPKNPVPQYRLFRVYSRLGQTAKATAARQLHERLAAQEKEELDKRQAETKHLDLKVRQ
ncbi:MAG: tetratricopeptide repeat protein [Acidobacteria bacterium]|nr:tetratricopeptide repeat protein [Acidobacteriota bacterium]